MTYEKEDIIIEENKVGEKDKLIEELKMMKTKEGLVILESKLGKEKMRELFERAEDEFFSPERMKKIVEKIGPREEKEGWFGKRFHEVEDTLQFRFHNKDKSIEEDVVELGIEELKKMSQENDAEITL